MVSVNGFDLQLSRGDSLFLRIDLGGRDLPEGTDAVFTVKKNVRSDEAVIQKRFDASDERVNIVLAPAETNLTPGVYYWDLRLQIPQETGGYEVATPMDYAAFVVLDVVGAEIGADGDPGINPDLPLLQLVIREASEAAARAERAANAQAPRIGENGSWWLWDSEKACYVDSGVAAVGSAEELKHVDALKLGGKPPEAYAAVNLLDNSRFEIAQAGYGGLHGNTKYAADRWSLSGGTAVWNGSNIVISSEVDGQQVNMVQKLADGTYKKGTVYTFAVMLADGTLGTVHGDFITSAYANIYDKEGKHVALGIQSDNVVIPVYTTGAHHIAWAALYEGAYTADSLPVYVPKEYAAELAECQRYYENSWFGAAKTDLFQMIGSCWNGSHFDVPVAFKQQKRTKPSMNYYPSGSRTTVQGFVNSAYRDVTILDPEYRMGLRGVYARVRVAEADLTIGYTYQLHAHWEANADL